MTEPTLSLEAKCVCGHRRGDHNTKIYDCDNCSCRSYREVGKKPAIEPDEPTMMRTLLDVVWPAR